MKTIKWIMAVMTVVLFGGRVLGQGIMVNYADGNTKLRGYYVRSLIKPSKAPGIVIIHQWMGLGNHEKNSANKLSALGYNALAADIYGADVHPKNTQEAGEKAGYYKNNYQVYQSRIKAAIAELIKRGADPNRIAVMGYCFGGSGAIEAARANMPVKGVISFHGGLGKDSKRPNSAIKTKVLVLHGADDPYESAEEIKNFQQEMREGKADWQMIYYANAVHAFTQPSAGTDNSKGAAYNPVAARRSWEHMKMFLKEIFK